MERLPELNAEVMLQISEDHIMGKLRSIEFVDGHTTYHVVARYKGWLVLAQASELLMRDYGEATYYTAHGDMDIRLVPPDAAEGWEKELSDEG